ncbi:hypothetical protein X997_5844 [Burkholderia pseudomallei A79C]|nr:hypothetical protein X997_5844 [Burkholderia pseudomallei A79C]
MFFASIAGAPEASNSSFSGSGISVNLTGGTAVRPASWWAFASGIRSLLQVTVHLSDAFSIIH